MRVKVCLFMAFFLIPASPALACEEYIAFGSERVASLIEKLKKLDESDFTVTQEFDLLICAEQKIVRDHVRRAGLRSKVTEIKSLALQSSVFEKDVILLSVVEKEGMTKREIEFFRQTPLIEYDVEYVDHRRGCLSLGNSKKCKPKRLLSVSGSEVDIHYYDQKAKLRLAEDGVLRGVWTDGRSQAPIQMNVELRLD